MCQKNKIPIVVLLIQLITYIYAANEEYKEQQDEPQQEIIFSQRHFEKIPINKYFNNKTDSNSNSNDQFTPIGMQLDNQLPIAYISAEIYNQNSNTYNFFLQKISFQTKNEPNVMNMMEYQTRITDIHYLNMLGNWRLIVLLSDSIEIIDPESMQKIIHLDTKQFNIEPTSIYFLHNKNGMVLGAKDSTVNYFSYDQNYEFSLVKVIYEASDNPASVNQLLISKNDQYVFFCEEQRNMQIYDISNIQNPKIELLFDIDFIITQLDLIHDDQQLIILTVFNGIQIYDISKLNEESLYTKENLLPIFHQKKSTVISLKASQNPPLLVSSDRASGIQIHNMYDMKDIYLLQILQDEGIGFFVGIWKDSQSEINYIYHLSKDSLTIYQQKSINQVIDSLKTFPHIFNIHQSQKYYHQGKITSPWRIFVNTEKPLMYLSYAHDGVQILDYTDPLNVKLVNNFHQIVNETYPSMVDSTTLKPSDQDIMVVAKGSDGVFIYNASDPVNLQFLGHVIVKGDSDDVKYFEDDNYLCTGSGLYGIAILNITDMRNPEVMGQTDLISHSIEEIEISRDEKYVFGAARYFGIFVFDIQDFNNIQVIKKIQTGGEAQGLIIPKRNNDKLIVAEGSFGISIWDISESQSPKQLSSKVLQGTAYRIAINKEENYLFVPQAVANQLIILDLTDWENPSITQINQQKQLEVYDLKLDPAEKHAYLLTQFGLQIFPIMTNHFIIQESYFNNEVYDKTQAFKVGQLIDTYLFNYRDPQKKLLHDVYYYNDKQLKELPQNINFIHTENKLNMHINNPVGTKIYIFQLRMQIDYTDFLYVSGSQNEDLAQDLLGELKAAQYIDDDFFPNGDLSKFEHLQLIQNTEIRQQVQFILNRKIEFIPVKMYIESSLQFNSQEQEEDIIFTYGQVATIILQIEDPNQGKFMLSTYDSVLGSLQNSQTKLTLQGYLEGINLALRENTRLQPIINEKDIVIQYTVSDDLGQFVQGNMTLREFSFIKINEPSKIIKSIQQDFESFYPGGNMYIQQNFEYQLKNEFFQDNDDTNLDYRVFLIQKGGHTYENSKQIEQQESIDELTINFNKEELKIEIHADKLFYGKSITLEIQVSDGYTMDSQKLYMKFNKLPALFIIYYLAYSVSPLVAIFGLSRLVGPLYNMCCQKKYKYKKFVVSPHEPFKLVIPLIFNRQENARQILKIIQRKLRLINKETKLKNIYQNIQEQNSDKIDVQKLNNILLDIRNERSDLWDKKENIDIQQQDQLSGVQQIIISQLYLRLIQASKPTQKVIEQLKQLAIKKGKYLEKDWYRYYTNMKIPDKIFSARPFPEIKIKNDLLYEELMNCKILKQHRDELEQLKEQDSDECNYQFQKTSQNDIEESDTTLKINNDNFLQQKKCDAIKKQVKIYLIKQAIIAAALGISQPSLFEYSSGISIYTRVEKIQKVTTLVKRRENKRNKITDSMLKLINFDWDNIPFSQNNPLPEYLQFKYHRDVLEITRIKPFRKEDKQFKLRIVSLYGFILKEIVIEQKSQLKQNKLEEQEAVKLNLQDNENSIKSSSEDISELSRQLEEEYEQIYKNSLNIANSQANNQTPSHSVRDKNKSNSFGKYIMLQKFQSDVSKNFVSATTQQIVQSNSQLSPFKLANNRVVSESQPYLFNKDLNLEESIKNNIESQRQFNQDIENNTSSNDSEILAGNQQMEENNESQYQSRRSIRNSAYQESNNFQNETIQQLQSHQQKQSQQYTRNPKNMSQIFSNSQYVGVKEYVDQSIQSEKEMSRSYSKNDISFDIINPQNQNICNNDHNNINHNDKEDISFDVNRQQQNQFVQNHQTISSSTQ